VHRRDVELLAARTADDLVVHTDQVVAQLGKFGAVPFIGAGRQPIFFCPANPAHRVVIGAAAPRTRQPLGPVVVLVEEKGAFV
jgi:hypothetical protein